LPVAGAGAGGVGGPAGGSKHSITNEGVGVVTLSVSKGKPVCLSV